MQHTFLYISWLLLCMTTTWNFQKLLSYTLYGGNVVRFPVHFFSLPLIFTLHWWPLAFLILSLPLHRIFMLFFQQKNVSFGFSSLALNSCRPLSHWALLACRPLSLFLWQFPTIPLPVFRSSFLTLLLSLLYKTPVAMRFPAKIMSCISVAIPIDWVILHWYACGADGQSLGRAVYSHVIKFYRRGRLLHFLTHGAPLARFAGKSCAKKNGRHPLFSVDS